MECSPDNLSGLPVRVNWRFDNQDYPQPSIDGIAPEEIMSAAQAGLPGTIMVPTGVTSY